MAQKIRIKIIDKNGLKRFVHIFRSSLSNYQQAGKWNKFKLWERIDFSRFKPIKYKRIPSRRAYGYVYVRFEFALRRREINDIDTDKLRLQLKKYYMQVLNKDKTMKGKKLDGQRLGLAFSSSDRKTYHYETEFNDGSKTRTKEREELDFITTQIYQRGKEYWDFMIEDIIKKLIKYSLPNYASLHEQESIKELFKFFVFFEQTGD